MKKISQLVLLLIISLTSLAQFPQNVFIANKIKKSPSSNNLRTTIANKQQLDSIVSSSTKDFFTYDILGNLTLQITYERSSPNDFWSLKYKSEFSYDANKNMISHIEYNWNAQKNSFERKNKYEYMYDTYNNTTGEIRSNWDALNSIWVSASKIENVFNSKPLITQSAEYYWSGTMWYGNGSRNFTYDNNYLLLKETEYTQLGLVESIKEYTYDVDGKTISEVMSRYNGTMMYNTIKYEYMYDSNGNQILELEYSWSSQTNNWVVTRKTKNEFDAQDNNINSTYSEWNISTNTWVDNSKNVYKYDYAYTTKDLILPEDLVDFSNNKIIEAISYDYVNGDWEEYEVYALFYTDLITTEIAVLNPNTKLSVYPNPTSSNIIFSNKIINEATLQLFNVQGEISYNKMIYMNQPVLLDGLSKGIYMYRVLDANANSYTGTLVID